MTQRKLVQGALQGIVVLVALLMVTSMFVAAIGPSGATISASPAASAAGATPAPSRASSAPTFTTTVNGANVNVGASSSPSATSSVSSSGSSSPSPASAAASSSARAPTQTPSQSPPPPGDHTGVIHIYARTNSTSIQTYALPEIQEFTVGPGSGTVSVTFVVLYLSGSGTASFSLGSIKFGHDILANTSVAVSGAGWYNTTIGPLNLNLGSNFYLNVYQTSGSVQWGYTGSPTVKINTLTEFYYSGTSLLPSTTEPNLYTVGGEVSPVTYSVTFSEHGMPTAAGGGVAFNGGSNTPFTSGGTVVFLATDGTYNFVITAATGYALISPTPGTTVTVNGAPTTVNIVFHAVYTVTFTETGLGLGASWSVTLNNTVTHTSTGTSVTFTQSNGTNLPFSVSSHGYSASPSSGTVTVAGANPASQAIAFTAIVLQNAIYAQTNTTALTPTTYKLPGIQEFTVGAGRGTVPVTFVALFLSGSGTASFTIGTGRFLSDELANTSVAVTHTAWYNISTLSINLPLGTNLFLNVYQTSGTVTWGYTGAPSVEVNTGTSWYYQGSNLVGVSNVPNLYAVGLSRPAGFAVTFQERGMPTAAGGGVSFNGGPLTPFASGGTVTFTEPNGNYPYTVTAGSGYSLVSSLPASPLTVSGSPVTVTVIFHELYTISFQATGLTGETWGATLNGTHLTGVGSGTLSWSLPNGTFTYAIDDVPGWHQTAKAYSGSGTVSGSSYVMILAFVQETYAVTYTASGLTGETWGITLNGTHQTKAGNGALSVSLPNGTYTWTLDNVPGWHTSSIAYSGSGTVTSSGVSVAVAFTQVIYAVTYTASGLTGETWGITLNGSHQTRAGNGALTVNLPNGTYTWTLDNVPGWHTTSIAYSGSGTVTSAGISISVVFTQVTYTVTYTASGLTGETWGITLNGTHQTHAGNGAITVHLPNGTYTWSLDNVPGWHTTSIAYSGSGTVTSAGISVGVVFTQVTYKVTFSETGMPPSAPSSGVIFNGSSLTAFGVGGVVSFQSPNGTYSYSITPGSGYALYSALPASPVTVTGGTHAIDGSYTAVTVTIVFHVVYTVTFYVQGLSGETWSVSLNGNGSGPQTGTSVAFQIGNGTFPYAFADVPGWHVTTGAYTGTITVNGGPTSYTVKFTQVVYAITFTETGMPPSAGGGVSFNGSALVSFGAGGTLTVHSPNGTYPYSISPATDYAVIASSPSPASPVTINGAPLSVTLKFHELYLINFVETGLTGETWGVTINGTHQRGTGTTLGAYLPNGTWTYTLDGVPGWYPSIPYSAAGSPSVAGAGFDVDFTFAQWTYTITFTETGMPPSAPSSGVSFNGSTVMAFLSGGSISFQSPNGSYPYSITAGSGYGVISSSPTSPLAISGDVLPFEGTAVTVTIVFGEVFTITFSETGLGGGDSWFVNATAAECSYPGATCSNSGTGTSLVLTVFNGTYDWTVASGGFFFQPSPPTGTTVVNGNNPTPSVTFALYTQPASFTEDTLPTGSSWFINLTGVNCAYAVTCSAGGASVTLTFDLPNGTYTYVVQDGGLIFAPSPATDSITVTGSGALIQPSESDTQTIVFTLVGQTVTFTQTTLGSWESWFVNVTGFNCFAVAPDGCATSGTGSSLTFTLPNGSYEYAVSSGGLYYGPSPAARTFTVSGSTVTILPGGGSSQAIAFTPYTTSVTFQPGPTLPTWESWFVNLTAQNGTPLISAIADVQGVGGSSSTIHLFNGTYGGLVSTGAFYFGPEAAKLSISVTYATPIANALSDVTFVAYTTSVTFEEGGLPSWAPASDWYVNGTMQNSSMFTPLQITGTSTTLDLFNGTYHLQANDGGGIEMTHGYYGAAPGSPQQNTTDIPSTTTYVWNFVPEVLLITISQVGLPSWAPASTWFLNLTAQNATSPTNLTSTGPLEETGGAAFTFNVFNGTYTVVASDGGRYYEPTTATKSLTWVYSTYVYNSWVAQVTSVTTSQTGLPGWAPADTWFLNLTAQNATSPTNLTSSAPLEETSGASFTFNVFNGTYTAVASDGGRYYQPDPATQSLTRAGGVSFTFSPITYSIQVGQSGLPTWAPASTWFLNLTAQNGSSLPTREETDGNPFTFYIFNGTYTATANDAGNYYAPSPAKQTLAWPTDLYTYDSWTPEVSAVTLTPSGLGSWTNTWYVNLTAANASSPDLSSSPFSCESNAFLCTSYDTAISFNAFNGTAWVANSWQEYYAPSPATQTVTDVLTYDGSVTVTFTAVVTSITVSQTGLPNWTPADTWFLNLTAQNSSVLPTLEETSGNSFTFNIFNGTYTATANDAGSYYAPSPAKQSLALPTTSYSYSTWTPWVSTVTLTPSGLPSWTTTWFVNLTAANSSNPLDPPLSPVPTWLEAPYDTAIAFRAFNGTTWVANSWEDYYGPSPAKGTITVGGTLPTTVGSSPVTFTAYYSTVTLTPSGLPSWTTTWFVNLTAYNNSAAVELSAGYNTAITFHAFNGTKWVANSWQEYYAPSPATQTVTDVLTYDGSVPVTFAAYVSTVTLTPSGLGSWTNTWFVNLTAANSTNPVSGPGYLLAAYNTAITFHAFNGTKWVANSWKAYYGPSPGTGTISVGGTLPSTAGSVTVTFTAYTERVTLSSSSVPGFGLPSWQEWFVNLTAANSSNPLGAGNFLTVGPTSSVAFNVFNGTKYVVNSWESEYGPALATFTYTGITTTGTTDSPIISWTPYTTSVSFLPSGVDALESYFVNLTAPYNSTTLTSLSESSAATTLTIHLFNGTYHYTVSTGGNFYAPSPARGSIPVSYPTSIANVLVSTTFTLQTFTVTFSESGLTGETWGVTLTPPVGGIQCSITGPQCTESGSGTSLTPLVLNGSYTWTLANVPGWRPGSYSGSVNVAGANPSTIHVTFTQVTYAVTYTASGLNGQTWGITLNSTHRTHSGNGAITVNLPNGTYTWSLDPVAGWVPSIAYTGSGAVTSAGVAVSFSFSQVTYKVTFTETGMPTAAGGGIYYNGSLTLTPFGLGGVVSFESPNGTVTYTVAAGTGYQVGSVSPSSPQAISGGTHAIDGSYLVLSVSVTLHAIYSVTFTETGLIPSAGGGVSFNGGPLTAFGAGGVVTFGNLANNTGYPYTITAPTGFQLVSSTPPTPVTVSGGPASVTVTFRELFTVTFSENGMPPSAGGGVSFNGGPLTAFGAGGSVTFAPVMNGTYPYTITAATGYTLLTPPSSGNVLVNGRPVVVIGISFRHLYSIQFSESGLPVGATWYLNFTSGPSFFTLPAHQSALAGSTITVSLINGSYNYAPATNNKAYSPPLSNSVTESGGSPASVMITFTPPIAPGAPSPSYTTASSALSALWVTRGPPT